MKKVVDKGKVVSDYTIESYIYIPDEEIGVLHRLSTKEYHFINLEKIHEFDFTFCKNIKIINTYKINNNYIITYCNLQKIKILNYRKLSKTKNITCNLKFFGKIHNFKSNKTGYYYYYYLSFNKLKNINFEPIKNNKGLFEENHNIIITKKKINI